MKPEPGLRLTIVAREPHTPYSGMLPGFVAGQYDWNDIHIDLLKLATSANCRFIADEVIGVDPEQGIVRFDSRPTLRFDVLSLNTGGTPGVSTIGIEHTVPVKPIGKFIPQWNALVSEAEQRNGYKLGIVGGGPGSIELALAIKEKHGNLFDIELISAANHLLPDHSRGAQKSVNRELSGKVSIQTRHKIVHVSKSEHGIELQEDSGLTTYLDSALWVTGVDAPDWLRSSNLSLSTEGFLSVNQYLQAGNYPNVFGAGDVVDLTSNSRPKSGVFAVREGPVLAHNIRAFAIGSRLRAFKPQRNALALLRLQRNKVLATRRFYLGSNRFWFHWKNWIDQRFMDKFQNLPDMAIEEPRYAKNLDTKPPDSMRCGGCGAKLGANVLEGVLRRLGVASDPTVTTSIGDDAAIVNTSSSEVVLTIDGFRSMISDPWQFGQICAHHALNDLYAMNATPRTALALVTVPVMSDLLMEEDLYQVMSGALGVFRSANVALVGGHSAEGLELSLGFALTGSLERKPWLKSGMRASDKLILSKPLGTGVILAGAMQRQVRAETFCKTVEQMCQSNMEAMQILASFDTSGCTDITGFGLLGHLSEMCRASEKSVEVTAASISTLPGSIDAFDLGIQSSLQPNNEQALEDWEIESTVARNLLKLMCDPQTSGGLLASVAGADAGPCLSALQENGYPEAVIIGEVKSSSTRNRIV